MHKHCGVAMDDDILARLLLDARHGDPVPSDVVPVDAAQAYRVQWLVMAHLGEIGGWKVGAASPDSPISCAPMPAHGLSHTPQVLNARLFTQREVESEICFRLHADLPADRAPHSSDAVLDAIATCHPGIEVLQSRYAAPDSVGSLALLADFIQTGTYVVGEPIEGWQDIDFSRMSVRQSVTGHPDLTVTANPAGGMLRLIVWLANEGAVWAGGLRAGQIVTCGSWTGKTRCPAGGKAVASFDGAAPVVVEFAA